MNPDPRTERHPLLGRGYSAFTPEIHSSSVDLFHACPRKFLYTERFHLHPRGSFRKALSVGTYYHLAMAEQIRSPGDAGAVTRVVNDAAATDRAEYMSLADATGMLPDGTSIDKLLGDLDESVSLALAMAAWTVAAAPWPRAREWTVLGVEVGIRYLPRGHKVPQRGTLDLVLQDIASGEIWIVDHKTTSYDPSTVAACYMGSTQARLYEQLARAIWHEQVVGICHNVIRKPTIKQKRNQSFEEYLDEVTDWYNGTGKHAATDRTPSDVFLRTWFRFGTASAGTYDDGASQEFALDLTEAETYSSCFPDMGAFGRRRSACMQYNSLCPFAGLCNTPVDAWDSVLPAFEVSHRDDTAPLVHDITEPAL